MSFAGFCFPEWQWSRRGQPRVRVHQDTSGGVRCPAALAVLPLRVLHPVRPDLVPREGLQHRGELHPRPLVEELPAAEPGARHPRLWIPPIRLARDDQEAPLRQGRRHVLESQGGPQQNCGCLTEIVLYLFNSNKCIKRILLKPYINVQFQAIGIVTNCYF